MKSSMIFGVLGASLALVSVAPVFGQADVAAGKIVFNQKCANCHTLSADPAPGPKGPNLMGVIGRTAGTTPGWDFSPALKASGLVLTEENLNKWLTDPEALVPGSAMPLKMPIKFEREDVIGYIKSMQPEKK